MPKPSRGIGRRGRLGRRPPVVQQRPDGFILNRPASRPGTSNAPPTTFCSGGKSSGNSGSLGRGATAVAAVSRHAERAHHARRHQQRAADAIALPDHRLDAAARPAGAAGGHRATIAEVTLNKSSPGVQFFLERSGLGVTRRQTTAPSTASAGIQFPGRIGSIAKGHSRCQIPERRFVNPHGRDQSGRDAAGGRRWSRPAAQRTSSSNTVVSTIDYRKWHLRVVPRIAANAMFDEVSRNRNVTAARPSADDRRAREELDLGGEQPDRAARRSDQRTAERRSNSIPALDKFPFGDAFSHNTRGHTNRADHFIRPQIIRGNRCPQYCRELRSKVRGTVGAVLMTYAFTLP